MTLGKPDFHTETGRLSLDWIATLGDRAGTPLERINNVADLERWLIDVAGHVGIRAPSAGDLDAALRLRTALLGILARLWSARTPDAQDIEILNEYAALPPPSLRLSGTGRTPVQDTDITPSTVFGTIARDAIDLFTGDDWPKVKLCAAPDCSVYFVDRSRPGKRRWCSMNRCGNKAKKQTFLSRSKKTFPA